LRLVPAAETVVRPPSERPATLLNAVIVALPLVDEAVSTSTSPLVATSERAPLVAVALSRLISADETSIEAPVTVALPGVESAPR